MLNLMFFVCLLFLIHFLFKSKYAYSLYCIVGSRRNRDIEYSNPDCLSGLDFLILCLRLEGGGPRVVVSTVAFHARVRGSVLGFGGLEETKMFLPHPRVKLSIVGSLRDRKVACSASDCQGSNLKSCFWRTVSSHSSHHP